MQRSLDKRGLSAQIRLTRLIRDLSRLTPPLFRRSMVAPRPARRVRQDEPAVGQPAADEVAHRARRETQRPRHLRRGDALLPAEQPRHDARPPVYELPMATA